MTGDDLSRAPWKKSSYSGNTGNCVEVAITQSEVRIRDSQDPDGAMLTVSRKAWREFTQGMRSE